MKNINSIKNVNDLSYKLKISFEEAKKDECFKRLVESINLKDEELMKYTSMLEDSVLEYKNCKDCNGLMTCKNNMNGFCYLPVLKDGKLNFSYVACRFKNKFLKENEYQKI